MEPPRCSQVPRLASASSTGAGAGPRSWARVLMTRSPWSAARRLEPGGLDLARFEELVAQGRRLLKAGDPREGGHGARAARSRCGAARRWPTAC